MNQQIICKQCNKPLTIKQIDNGNKKYCSPNCYYKSKEKKIKKECLSCKQTFYTIKYVVDKGYGKYCSKSCSNRNRKLSNETKLKISKGNKGKIVSKETRLKLSKKLKGRTNRPAGWKHSKKTRLKMSLNHKVYISKKTREKQSNTLKKIWARKSLRKRKQHTKPATKASQLANPSSIELAIRKVLDSLDITYIPQHPIGWYHVDIFIPSRNLVIECDGDYYHNLPGAQEKDKQRDKYLKNKGYKVVRLWEHEIKKDAEKALLRVIK